MSRVYTTDSFGKRLVAALANADMVDPDEERRKALTALNTALDATGRERGDPQPTAEELLDALNGLGYAVIHVGRPAPKPDAT